MKKATHSPGERRKFIRQSMTILLSATVLPSFARQEGLRIHQLKDDKKPPLAPELVSEFVRLAHFDLEKVKEMLDQEPMLANATWDWGGGDFETALGGASHVGNSDIANYLLAHGSRKDIFCSAMLDDADIVKSFLRNNPSIANVDGPHHFSLLYHVAISGNTKMADMVKPHIADKADFNQALHAAAKKGHIPMTEWLIRYADDLNTTDFAGRTSLENAEKRGFKELADVLRKKGAK